VIELLFSVVIPVYNVKDYLSECIDSALAQTYGDCEIILVDDGSSDGSGQICDRYSEQHSNIRVVHKENAGQSSARNIGVDMVKGQYFIFVDSDDYIAPDTLEMFEHKIRTCNEPDVILSDRMYNVEPDGTVRDLQRHLDVSEFDGITGQEAILKMGMEWSPCGKCYKTSFWKGKGFRFTEGIISEDFQLIDRVTIEAQKVAMIPAHYYYRWKIESSTMHKNYGKLVKDTIYVIEDWDKYLNDRAFDKDLDDLIRYTIVKMFEHDVMGNAFYVEVPLRDEILRGIEKNVNYLKYDKSYEGMLVTTSIKVIGIKNTCVLLNRLKTIRKKRV